MQQDKDFANISKTGVIVTSSTRESRTFLDFPSVKIRMTAERYREFDLREVRETARRK